MRFLLQWFPPAASISGSKTHLTNTLTAGVDSAGKIYVTTFAFNGKGVEAMLAFKATANGNVKPVENITGSKVEMIEAFYPTIR